jgi:outer membrane protein assembly factor BamB
VSLAGFRPGRRRLSLGLAAGALLGLNGCGSSRQPLPELPQPSGAARVARAWTLDLGKAGFGFQPALVGDSILALASEGVVVRLDAASGREIWRVDLERALVGGAGSDGETTAVAARDGTLIVLDSAGRQKWTARPGAEIASVPAVGFGLVVVRGTDNRVSAYDAGTGTRRWTFDRQPTPLVLRQTASVTVDRSSVYVGLPGGRLIAIAAGNGAQRWEVAVGVPRGSNEIERIADVVGAPLSDGRQVCAVAWQGRLGCYDAQTGRVVWARDFAAGAGLAGGAGLLATVDSAGDVHAFSRSGAGVWRQDALRRRQPSTPVVGERHVVVGDALGLVHLLSVQDGALLARFDTDGSAIVSSPLAWKDLFIVQTAKGSLHAIKVD